MCRFFFTYDLIQRIKKRRSALKQSAASSKIKNKFRTASNSNWLTIGSLLAMKCVYSFGFCLMIVVQYLIWRVGPMRQCPNHYFWCDRSFLVIISNWRMNPNHGVNRLSGLFCFYYSIKSSSIVTFITISYFHGTVLALKLILKIKLMVLSKLKLFVVTFKMFIKWMYTFIWG